MPLGLQARRRDQLPKCKHRHLGHPLRVRLDEVTGRACQSGPACGLNCELQCQVEEAGVNYMLLDFAFGDLTLEESLRSVDLFSKLVMPEFAAARYP